jgi:ABC-type phosphate transport system substrate-binding protein
MKRILAVLLCLALLCPMALAAEPDRTWSRTEPGGRYVTLRLEAPAELADLDWSGQRNVAVRYADTGEPAPLNDYMAGENVVFVTVPASRADRPLEVYQAEEIHFPDCVRDWGDGPYQDVPAGTYELTARGLIQGDGAGNLKPDRSMTRAELAVLLARLLSLEPGEDPGYADVAEDAWYYDAVSGLRTAGIVSADTVFRPDQPVTRAEFMVLFARAMEYVGWLTLPEEAGAELEFLDAADIPAWALPAYEAFAAVDAAVVSYSGSVTQVPTGQPDPITGEQTYDLLAEPHRAITRDVVIESLYFTLRDLPWYPTELAIELGFDETMPTVDGSTSTYPYTEALFTKLFLNYRRHPDFPAVHSTSHTSYERLIAGEVDVLFAATPPSADLMAQAEKAGVKLESVPIAHDAMVFFTNAQNKVDGLTRQQIQDIYVYGKYDNWQQLGGDDAVLLPYRRNVDSGSHALMEQYFLEGGKLSLSPDVHNVLTSHAMSSALTDVVDALSTDPPAYAIGYSVYYYYTGNFQFLFGDGDDFLKLLAVDGVYPTDATIADGSYPLAGYNYVVYRADAPKDAPARRLADFMLSTEGQGIVASAGFGPLHSDPESDLATQLPGWTVEEVFLAPNGTEYLALSRNDSDGALRGSWLRRSTWWGELLCNECQMPEDGKVSAAYLQNGPSFVFGLVGSGGPFTVRLTDDQGAVQTQAVAGGSFHFLTDGKPVRLELLRGETVVDTDTEFER